MQIIHVILRKLFSENTGISQFGKHTHLQVIQKLSVFEGYFPDSLD